MPTVILEGLYAKIINNNNLKVVQESSIAKSVPSLRPTTSTTTSQNLVTLCHQLTASEILILDETIRGDEVCIAGIIKRFILSKC